MNFLDLPLDIIFLIIRMLNHDLETLRNVALVCRVLLMAIREDLLTAVNIRALQEPFMRPYLSRVQQLSIAEPSDIWRISVVDARIVPHLDPHTLSGLRAIRMGNLHEHFLVEIPTSFFTALSALVSVTTLILSKGVYFVSDDQIRLLLGSLPCLSELGLSGILPIPLSYDMWKGRDLSEGYAELEYPFRKKKTSPQPTLSKLTITTSSTTCSVARWLSRGPCKSSLTSLIITARSPAPHAVLKHFGSNVEHLSFPLQGRDCKAEHGRNLGTYTSLRTFTTFLGAKTESPDAWALLPRLLNEWLPAKYLREITLEVCAPRFVSERGNSQSDTQVDWNALRLLDDVLTGPRFSALRSVVVVIQSSKAISTGKDVWEGLARRVENALGKVMETRKLVTVVGGVYVEYHSRRNGRHRAE